ncbi:TPA: terminase family protein [Enterobacter asburiae]|nr:terminase family protein [Enterobacter asburiae]
MSKTFGPASPKQKMILENNAQILIIGGAAGSGKSYLLQLMPLNIIDDPRTNCIMFRRNTPQLKGGGGLYDTARGIYTQLDPEWKPRFREKDLEAIFPSGAKVKWSHMEYEKDKYSHQGLQYTFVGFDEGTQFEWSQIEYLMSRLRSESKYPSRMVISCNPDPDHKIKELIEWYLDDDGFPIPERDGVIRWFIRRDGEFIWGDTAEELIEQYWDGVDIRKKPKPLSFSFISATIFDNPPMLDNNPDYLAFLEGLPEIEKAQLLHGNWKVRPEGANYFQRSYLKEVPCLPLGVTSVRPYDKAGTERTSGNRYPDFTASIKVSKDSDGFYYLSGDYCPEFVDDGQYSTQTQGRFCKKAGERDVIIRKQAHYDGDDVVIIFSVDPGQAGISEFTTSSRELLAEGFVVERDPTPGNKSKLTRFTPFAKLAQSGMVRIVRSSFDAKTYEALMTELEKFNGERSTTTRKDDWADAVASGINYLEKNEIVRPVVIPKIVAPTLYKRI